MLLQLEMLGWKGEDLSPNQDGSIVRTILETSDKKRSPSDGAFVKGRFIFKKFLWLRRAYAVFPSQLTFLVPLRTVSLRNAMWNSTMGRVVP